MPGGHCGDLFPFPNKVFVFPLAMAHGYICGVHSSHNMTITTGAHLQHGAICQTNYPEIF